MIAPLLACSGIIKFNYIIMQDIREAISDLLSGHAKQATFAIDMLINSDQNFFPHLTALILGTQTPQLQGRALSAGLATFNSAALRLRGRSGAKDFLVLQEIYGELKTIMCSGAVDFQKKKLLHPSLTQMVGSHCARHKEVVELKEMVKKSQDRRSILLIVSAITSSKILDKHIKIQCIMEMFDIMMEETISYTNFLTHPNATSPLLQLPTNAGPPRFEDCIGPIKYSIDLLHTIFHQVFQSISQPYEYEGLLLLASNPQFSKLILLIVGWRNPSTRHSCQIPWLEDLKLGGSTVCQFYQINNIKQKAFQIISVILHNTSPGYNFFHTSNQLLQEIPQLCKKVILEVMSISGDFKALNDDFLIGSLCDSMLQLMGETLRFNDLLIIYAENLSLDELIVSLAMYLRVRDTDISSMEGEYFCHFLEGFAGGLNFNQISRYSITYLIEACCNKFDRFPVKMFNYCFHGMLNSLHSRLTNPSMNIDEDCYQHLYRKSIDFECIERFEDADIGCCLLGLVTLHKQIAARDDFKYALVEFFIILDPSHFNKEELTIIYYLISTHIQVFQDDSLIQVAPVYIHSALALAESDSNCSILCFEFIKKFYLSFLITQSLTNPMSPRYLDICSKAVWPELIKGFRLLNTSQNEYFWEIVRDLIAVPNLMGCSEQESTHLDKYGRETDCLGVKEKTKRKIIKVQRVGEYLITQISGVILKVLEESCEKQQKLAKSKEFDDLMVERVHQLIMECIGSLCWINQQDAELEFKRVQFKNYVGILEAMIVNVMHSDDPNSFQIISARWADNFMQILSTLITQQLHHYPVDKPSSSPITSRPFEALLPTMLGKPFTEHWLTCICEFTHRIEGKYKLSEVQQILDFFKLAYTQNLNNQERLNEVSLFAIVLLNYEQPENWCKLHEIVRVNLVKFLRIESVQNKLERKKKIKQLGFESETIFGISIIRLFHVYLFGFRLEPVHELMSQMLREIERFVEKYTFIEASHLIIGLKSSYKFMNRENWEKILALVLLVLTKLMSESCFYGHQSHQESAIRRLGQKIGCMGTDPYQQFRSLVQLLQGDGVNLEENDKFGTRVRSMMNIITKQGHPRKLYSILRPKV